MKGCGIIKYRNVGKSGLKVSEITVGSWMTELSGSEKIEVAKQTIRYAYDNGVNFSDCTDDNLDKVEKLSKIAEELGTSMSALSLAWILRKK